MSEGSETLRAVWGAGVTQASQSMFTHVGRFTGRMCRGKRTATTNRCKGEAKNNKHIEQRGSMLAKRRQVAHGTFKVRQGRAGKSRGRRRTCLQGSKGGWRRWQKRRAAPSVWAVVHCLQSQPRSPQPLAWEAVPYPYAETRSQTCKKEREKRERRGEERRTKLKSTDRQNEAKRNRVRW